MSKSNAKPITELPDLPRLEDYLSPNHGGARDGAGRKRTHRKNITIYIKAEIIEALGPNPGTKLREWIEENFD